MVSARALFGLASVVLPRLPLAKCYFRGCLWFYFIVNQTEKLSSSESAGHSLLSRYSPQSSKRILEVLRSCLGLRSLDLTLRP